MKFTEIGEWSEIKLDIIGQYAVPYALIMDKKQFNFYYIDAFCGAGLHISRNTKEAVAGSPLRVLGIEKPFNRYYFIDLDGNKTDFLKNLCQTHYPSRKIAIETGDCNDIIAKLLPRFSYENRDRFFCLLDPYGLHLKWEIISGMGKSGIADIILNFPVMDINLNAIWRDYEKVPQWGLDRMTAFWGDNSWKEIVYKKTGLFDMPEKQSNDAVAEAFRNRLHNVAGFKYVPQPIAMKNSMGATVYYLFFASQNPTADKIAKYLFKKYGGAQ